MKKNIFYVLVATAIFTACSNNVIIDETHEFANATWQRFEPEVFSFDIKNTDDCYDIYFKFRIDTNTFRPESLPFICSLMESADYKRQLVTDIKIRDKRGNWLGNPVGGFYEYNRKVREYFFFNMAGSHELQVKNGSQYFETKGIVSFGIKIEKVNMDLKIN